MMKRTGAMILIAALIPTLAIAAEQPPQPKTPLLSRAPARAEWTVRLTEPGDNTDAETQRAMEAGLTEDSTETRKPVAIGFSKDSRLRTYKLHTRWSDGKSEDEWIVAGNHVADRPGDGGFYIVGSEDSTAGDLASSDFPELKWLDISYYRGIKLVKDKKVFVFTVPFDQKPLSGTEARLLALAKQSDPTATPSKVFKPKISDVLVYLDTATQLPVLYNDGTTLRTYTFEKAPDTPLRPSDQVLTFLRERSKALSKKLATPPGP